MQNEREIEFYLKVARHSDADLGNEAAALQAVGQFDLAVPRVVSFGHHEGHEYLAVSAMPGKRLSALLTGEDEPVYKGLLHGMLRTMGRNLAEIHKLPLNWKPVHERRQHKLPVLADGTPVEKELKSTVAWLRKNPPLRSVPVFIHGDHHYANLLWQKETISAILDWELCGMGWREFDLAWAVAFRPSQLFLSTHEELETVLTGYREVAEYDDSAFLWCLKLIYCHFLNIKSIWEDEAYRRIALETIKR
ncbi:MAG: aminoglycoside phosphotransferase family protein [Anaerolineales bacterium]|nr:aminoglycoside phosphotransferase family protein [Anaerolineales bacterium]